MPSVDLLFGPMLIGVYLNTILYGVLLVQSFIYYQTYRKDQQWIRYFVLFLVFCETLNTGFDIYMMYEPLVQRYGTERAVTIAPIMLSADPIMTVVISASVQAFISWRIRVISGSKLLAILIDFFAVCSFIGGIATTISVTYIPQYTRLQQFDGAVITWLASSAAADIIITSSLVWSLRKRKTGNTYTDDVINRIIRLTLQTGAITAIFATLDVVIFLAVPHTTLNFIWDFALGKLYTNSLLSTLNARAGWDNLNGEQNPDNVLFGTTAGSGNPNRASVKQDRYKHKRSIFTNTSTGIELRVPEAIMTIDELASVKGPSVTDLESGITSIRTGTTTFDPSADSKVDRSITFEEPAAV